MPWYVVVVEKWGFVLLCCCGHVLCVCCRGRFGDVIHVSIPNFDPVDDILALFETEYRSAWHDILIRRDRCGIPVLVSVNMPFQICRRSFYGMKHDSFT